MLQSQHSNAQKNRKNLTNRLEDSNRKNIFKIMAHYKNILYVTVKSVQLLRTGSDENMNIFKTRPKIEILNTSLYSG